MDHSIILLYMRVARVQVNVQRWLTRTQNSTRLNNMISCLLNLNRTQWILEISVPSQISLYIHAIKSCLRPRLPQASNGYIIPLLPYMTFIITAYNPLGWTRYLFGQLD